ncbi:MAG: hypothetical protein JO230_07230 [Xanthobacteraceae bacterium]|nr:hypothetical protein [Xanthobacteraceae bacterium]
MDDEDDALKEGNTGGKVAGATSDEALTVGELRAELVRLRARVVSLEATLAEERRAFVLFRAAQPTPTLYELSEKARQDLARDIWAFGRRMSFGHRLLIWLRRKLNIPKD